MKIITSTTITTLFFCISFWGNSQAIIGKSYLTVANNITVYHVDDLEKEFLVPKGTKFSVDGFEDGTDWVFVSFWDYNTGEKKVKKEAEQVSLEKLLGEEQQKSLLEIDGLDTPISEKLETMLILDVEEAYIEEVLRKKKHELSETDVTLKLALGKKYIGLWANHLQFKMKLSDLNDKTIEYHGKAGSFTYGVMTLPIKLRFGNGSDRQFNFEENLNLGFTFGYKKQPQSRVKQSHNFLGSVGISRVELNENSLNAGGPLDDDTASGIMLSAGYLYQYEAFQVGMFFGTDLLPGALSRQWKFQGKPWLGIAIGVALFSNDTDKIKKGTN